MNFEAMDMRRGIHMLPNAPLIYDVPINRHIVVYEENPSRAIDYVRIAGYRKTTLFSQRVQLVPGEERPEIQSKLKEIIRERDKKLGITREVRISFWD